MLKVKNINYPFWRIDKEKSIELIKEGGWHFSYLMNPEEIANKIQNAGHTELNKPEFRSIEAIKNNIKNLKDPFNRDLKFKKTIIDQSYPQYIRSNLDLFSHWIEK
jgi:beta-1,4-mannosyl-glycoprotein beta-1,4-N-acetylglucosaminyltransferase